MKPIVYFTKEAAEEAVERIFKKDSEKFCPLIKSNCREDCVSRVRPQVRNAGYKSGKYTVHNYRCVNALVNGVLEVEGI